MLQSLKKLAVVGSAFALLGCSGNEALLNPAHIDSDFKSSRSGAAPGNVDLYAGDLDTETRTIIKEGTFFPAWRAAAQADQRTRATSLPGVASPAGSTDSGNAEATAKVMLMRGIALSDRLCAAWFQKLGESQANMTFSRDVLSSSGGLAAAIMGLTRTAAPAIAGVGAATAFGQQLIDSASSNFIVAPDVGLVQDLVTRLRADQAEQLTAKPKLTYDDVLIMLVAYDNTCTHTKIKQLVNQSVTNATRDVSAQNGAVIQTIISEIAPYFNVKLSSEDVIALYALLVAASDSAVKSQLPAFHKTLSDDKVATAASTATSLKLNLASPYDMNSASAMASIKATLHFLFPRALLDAKLKAGGVASATGTANPPASVVSPAVPRAATPTVSPAARGTVGPTELNQRTLTLPSILR